MIDLTNLKPKTKKTTTTKTTKSKKKDLTIKSKLEKKKILSDVFKSTRCC